MAYYVCILTSARHGTLYVGVTNDIARRIYEHREGLADERDNPTWSDLYERVLQ